MQTFYELADVLLWFIHRFNSAGKRGLGGQYAGQAGPMRRHSLLWVDVLVSVVHIWCLLVAHITQARFVEVVQKTETDPPPPPSGGGEGVVWWPRTGAHMELLPVQGEKRRLFTRIG